MKKYSVEKIHYTHTGDRAGSIWEEEYNTLKEAEKAYNTYLEYEVDEKHGLELLEIVYDKDGDVDECISLKLKTNKKEY